MKEKSKHYYDCDRNKPIETTPCYYIGLDGMKAIDHLEYELNQIKKNKGRGCCNLK